MKRWWPVVVVVASVALAVARYQSYVPGFDAMPDWIFTRSAWSGVDPYTTPWQEQAQGALDYGPASKTPAVAAVASPWLLVPVSWVPVVALAVNIAALVGGVWLAFRINGRRVAWWMVAPGAAFSMVSLQLGNPIFVWAFLALATWRLSQTRDAWWVGMPLGVAVAVRLWPGLLVVALWAQGRRRSAVGAGVVAVGLNLAGLASPGVTVDGSINGLLEAGGAWLGHPADVSLLRLIGWRPAMVVIVAVAVAVAYKRGRMSESAVLSVLAAPVAWATYWLVALPAVIGLRSRWALLPVALIGLRPAWWTVPVGGLVVLALLLGVEVEVGDIADPVGVDERGESPRIGIGTEEEPEIVGGGSPPW